MKGRNTVVVSLRLPDSVYTILVDRAKGLSVAEYLKQQIIHSVNNPVNTIEVHNLTDVKTKLKAAGIRLEGNKVERVIKPAVLHIPTPAEKKEWGKFKDSLR